MEQSTPMSPKKNFFSNLPNVNGKILSIIIPVFILLLFTGLVFWLYSESLESPFTFDDTKKIERNPHVRVTVFSPKEIVSAGLKSSKTRFVAFISFALNYYFHQYDPFGYHIFNNIIHILTGFFLYLFLKATLNTSSLSSRDDHHDLIAFLAALIWLLHPVQTQSVTYIVQRMNSMASMFFILSFWCYVRGRGIESGRAKWLWFTGSALGWLLSLGCKQITVTLPFFVFLYEWFFFQDLDKNWLKRRLPFMLGILALLAFLALAYTGFHPLEKLNQFRDYGENQFTMGERTLTQTRVVMHYISLLIFPHPSRLNLDYDFPLSYSLINPISTLFSLTAIVGLIILGASLAKKQRLISFCILWFFGNLVIESSVIPLALIFEHRIYLPSMLLFLIPIALGHRYIKKYWLRAGLLCLAVVVLSVWTYQRNRVWQTDLSLWTDVVSKSPEKARPHLNLGLALAVRDRTEEAIDHYLKSLDLNPNYVEAHNNLGMALKEQGRIDEAIAHYVKAIQLDPNFAEAHNNLGMAIKETGKINEAIQHYRRALQISPTDVEAHNNLGVALKEQGRLNEAIQHYRRALQINPMNVKAHNNLGNALSSEGKANEAIEHFRKALQINPNFAEAHNNLGGQLLRQGKTDEAREHFTAALSLDPDLAQAHSNLGILMLQKGEIETAIFHFQEALRINPDSSLAEANLKKVLAIQQNVTERTAQIQEALNNNPDDPRLHFEMGNIFLSQAQFGRAIRQFEKALSIQPQLAPAQYNLALAYAAGKQYDEALDAFKKTAALQPDNANIYYNIAAMYALQNNATESLAWLKKSIAMGYDNWELIKTDKDLENIRNSEDYRQLLKGR